MNIRVSLFHQYHQVQHSSHSKYFQHIPFPVLSNDLCSLDCHFEKQSVTPWNRHSPFCSKTLRLYQTRGQLAGPGVHMHLLACYSVIIVKDMLSKSFFMSLKANNLKPCQYLRYENVDNIHGVLHWISVRTVISSSSVL